MKRVMHNAKCTMQMHSAKRDYSFDVLLGDPPRQALRGRG